MSIETLDGFEYRKGSYDRLSSGGLGSSIAVGAMHNGVAYMVVFMGGFYNLFDEFLDDLKALGDPTIKIYAGGGALWKETGSEREMRINYAILDDRSYVASRLEEARFIDVTAEWADENSAQEMTLILDKNKPVFEETPMKMPRAMPGAYRMQPEADA